MSDSPDPVPLFGPEMHADPYGCYRRLRELCPVHWSEPFQAWIVTSYDAVAAALADPRLSSDRASRFAAMAGSAELQPFFDFLAKRMVLRDPPAHTRLRHLVSLAFTPKAVEAMRPHIQELVDGLIEAAMAKGELDLIRDLAFPLPATVIMEMLGIPPADRDEFHAWSDSFVTFFSTHPSKVSVEQYREALAAMRAMVKYFQAVLPRIRAEGKSCLLSALAEPDPQGDRLSDEEIYANANLLLIAGHETTTHLIGNGMLALLRQPDQYELLLREPARTADAVEEFLRLVGPVQFTHRLVAEEMDLGGQRLKKGDLVFLFLAAANRDPAHFPEPDELRITRAHHKHLAFGLGHHFCLGAPLARLEAQIAFSTLLRRLPGLRLVEEKPRYQANFNLHGLVALPLAWNQKVSA